MDEGAVVVIAAPLSDLPMIAKKLLELCAFGGRPLHALPVRRPASWDYIDDEFILVAHRRDVRLCMPEEAWFDDAGPIDPLAFATRVCPGAAPKLHVFATARTEGWMCLVGDDSWIAMPSIP